MIERSMLPEPSAPLALFHLQQPSNGIISQVDNRSKSIEIFSGIDNKILRKFRAAVTAGDIDCLEEVLTSMPSDESRAMLVDSSSVLDLNMLHWAAFTKRIDLARLAIRYGANVNKQSKDGSTALHYTAFPSKDRRGQESSSTNLARAMADVLIEARADVNMQDLKGATPLHVTVEKKNEPVAERLLELSDIKPNIADTEGHLPLHLACGEHYVPRIARMLLDAVWQRQSLEWDLKTRIGRTPLHFAVEHNHPRLVDEILDHEICTQAQLVKVDDKDKNGDTALHLAARFGLLEICERLLQHGAVECSDLLNTQNLSPLDLAASGGHRDICLLLFGRRTECAPVVNAKAFMVACESGQVEIVRAFADSSLLYFYQRQNEPNFLSLAITSEHKQVAKYLVQESGLWHNALCSHVIRKEDRLLDTPMRALVRTMPDVARQALNRCTDITDTTVRFAYEFVDDSYSKWQPLWKTWNNSGEPNTWKNFYRNKVMSDLPYATDARMLQDNHVISLMIKNGQDDLLKHPLLTTLIGQKWKKFGRLVFLASFVGYFLYLALLTSYSVSVAPVNSLFYINETFHPFWTADICDNSTVPWPLSSDIDDLNQAEVCRVITEYQKPPYNCSMKTKINFATHFAQFTLLFVSFAMLATKLALILALHSFGDLFACCVNLLTILVTIPWHGFDCFFEFGLLQSWTWQVASVNILLAYVHLALKLEFAPGIGIYVHMLRNVSATMLRVLAAPFGIVLSALALCFHKIFKASVRHDQHPKLLVDDRNDHSAGWELNPFYTVPKSILKTLVMFIGEYDLETHFTANDVAIAPVALILLALFGTIALMNLLTSLAISDVGILQDHAESQQLKMQITYALNVERIIRLTPLAKFSYFKNLLRSEYISYYNLDGVLLQQTDEYTESLSPDKDKLSKSTQSKIAKCLAWCYYKVLVGRHYTTNFRVRLQEIASEKSKFAQEVKQAKRLAEKAVRFKNGGGITIENLSERMEAMKRETEALKSTVIAKLEEITRRFSAAGAHTP